MTRLGSLIETVMGTVIGFVFSIALSIVVYPAFGHRFTLIENAWITAIFTVASIARGYVLRAAAQRAAQALEAS